LLVLSLIGVLGAGALYEVQHRVRRRNEAVEAQRGPQAPVKQGEASAPRPLSTEMVGVVVALDDAVLAFKSAGRLNNLMVQVGDQVKVGAKLAELDSAEAQREVAQAKARVSSAQAELSAAWVKVKQAKDRLGRLEETAQFISQEKLESARTQVRVELAGAGQAQARVAQEREALAMTQLAANETTLRAPFAGTVSAMLAQRGARVSANQPVIRLIGMGEKRVRFAVPAAQLDAVTEHSALRVELSPNKEVPGIVQRLAPGFDPTLRYRLAEASLEGEVEVPAGIPVTVRLDEVRAQGR
jgi:RND family efflux transporter MFP subunit